MGHLTGWEGGAFDRGGAFGRLPTGLHINEAARAAEERRQQKVDEAYYAPPTVYFRRSALDDDDDLYVDAQFFSG